MSSKLKVLQKIFMFIKAKLAPLEPRLVMVGRKIFQFTFTRYTCVVSSLGFLFLFWTGHYRRGQEMP